MRCPVTSKSSLHATSLLRNWLKRTELLGLDDGNSHNAVAGWVRYRERRLLYTLTHSIDPEEVRSQPVWSGRLPDSYWLQQPDRVF